jgi:predicted metal-dependent HD superfamily phosphohydrolase
MVTPAPPSLRPAWHALLTPFAADPAVVAGEVDDLLRRHAEPHRRYHTATHLDEMLAAVDQLADLAVDLVAVRLAVWYHDAVYDPQSAANEERSAALAASRLPGLGVDQERVGAVADLVRLTADHAPSGSPDAAVLSDADLWILGTDEQRYGRYVAEVRAEYAHLGDDAWRAGRGAVLESFLARPRIFATDRFHRRYDERARANLEGERSGLGG